MNLYEKTRETSIAAEIAEARYQNSFRVVWHRWPSVKSLTCLILKFSLAGLLASLLLAVPVGVVALIVAIINSRNAVN